jgi:hypothetical protein
MQWIPIFIWTGLSGGFDWTPEQGSRNSWRSVRHPPLGSRSTWWGALVFCDPKAWPKDPEKLKLPNGWIAAVGVHPKHVGDFGDCYFDHLSRLMNSPAVTTLAEVGLDCSKGAGSYPPIHASGTACPGFGGRPPCNGCFAPEGIGRDAGEGSQLPARYDNPPPPLPWDSVTVKL